MKFYPKALIFTTLFLKLLLSQSSWLNQSIDSKYNLEDAYFLNDSVGWVCGYDNSDYKRKGVILKTTDGGDSWNLVYSFNEFNKIVSLTFSDSLTGWFCASGNLYRSVDGGETWNKFYFHPSIDSIRTGIKKILFTKDGVGWLLASLGQIIKTTDNGNSWSMLEIPTHRNLRSLFFLDSLRGWVCGDYGTVLRTGNGGKTWYWQKTNTPWHLYDVKFYNDSLGIVTGQRVALRTTNGGKIWSEVENCSGNVIYFINSDTVIVGYINLRKSIDSGETWCPINIHSYNWIKDIEFVNNTGWAIGWFGKIVKTNKAFGPFLLDIDSNIALTDNGTVAFANGEESEKTKPEYSIDGSDSTYWAGTESENPQILYIMFDNAMEVDAIKIIESVPGSYIKKATIEYYDGKEWLELLKILKYEAHYYKKFDPKVAERLRLKIFDIESPENLTNKVARISSFEVNGFKFFKNVALRNKGATASDNGHYDTYEAKYAIDANIATYWWALENNPINELTISMDKYYLIDKINIIEGKDYILTGDINYYDGHEWKYLLPIDKSTPGIHVEFPQIKTKKINLKIFSSTKLGNKNNKAAIIKSFEIMRGDAPRIQYNENIASSNHNATVESNGQIFDHNPEKVIDRRLNSYWAGLQDSSPQVITINFDNYYHIYKLRIIENILGSFFKNGNIEFYDGNEWQLLIHVIKNKPDYFYEFTPVIASKIRLKIYSSVAPEDWLNKVACISSFEVFGNNPLIINRALVRNGSKASDNGHYGNQVPTYAIDDDNITFWAGLQFKSPQELVIDLDKFYEINKINIIEKVKNSFITKAVLFYRNDTNWNQLIIINKARPNALLEFNPVYTNSILLRIDSVHAPSGWANKVACINSFEVFGRDFTNIVLDNNKTLNYFLSQNYPNPFNPTTTIKFTLPQSSLVKLEIFNTLGQKIKKLVDKAMPAGNHVVTFDGKGLASGVYYYKITAGKFTQVKKMLLIK